jgi:hypothetical protein
MIATKTKKQTKPMVTSIVIEHIITNNNDTSWLGTYSNTWQSGAIKRYLAPRREYQYFIPGTSYTEHFKGLHKMGYSKGNCDYLARQYNQQDFQRMEDLNNGNWHFIGIRAKATVIYPIGNNDDYRVEHFTSDGLYGIESDSKDYIVEVEHEQLASLKNHLKIFNVNIKNFDALAINAEVKDIY